MKLLILGKNGQVGWELQRALQPLGDVLALSREVDEASGLCGDMANFAEISRTIATFQPNVVVNATAYTAVDKAESEAKQADLINHLAVQNLAESCRKQNALLIHYSTDYVFNGMGDKAWQEDDATDPINEYGKSKRMGELALERSGVQFINLRTSWVYGTHGNNFIKTMLRFGKERETLSVINDQIGAPTGSALIADVTAQIIRFWQLNIDKRPRLTGHYHLAPQGETSWFDFAEIIFMTAKKQGAELAVQHVNAIPTTDYPTPAKRPLNSRLNTQKLQNTFQIHLPQWQQGVAHVLGELL